MTAKTLSNARGEKPLSPRNFPCGQVVGPAFRCGMYYFGSDLFDNTASGGIANLETYAALTHWLSAIRMRSPSDFDPNSKIGKYDCVGNLLVISHGGHRGNDAVYVNWGNDSLWESERDHSLSSAILSVKFCKKCKIELRACYVGRSQALKQKLEKIGCEVVLHPDMVNPVDGGKVEDEE